MGCNCRGNSVETREVTFSYLREALLYDIRNYAYVEGDTKMVEDEHERHQVMDIGEDGNVDRVTRVLTLAVAECIQFMYPYTKMPIKEDMELWDDRLEDPAEYRIRLTVPATMSLTTVALVKTLVHEYIVCRVLYDWLTITDAESAPVWLEKVETLKQQIRSALQNRGMALKRKMSPF